MAPVAVAAPGHPRGYMHWWVVGRHSLLPSCPLASPPSSPPPLRLLPSPNPPHSPSPTPPHPSVLSTSASIATSTATTTSSTTTPPPPPPTSSSTTTHHRRRRPPPPPGPHAPASADPLHTHCKLRLRRLASADFSMTLTLGDPLAPIATGLPPPRGPRWHRARLQAKATACHPCPPCRPLCPNIYHSTPFRRRSTRPCMQGFSA